MSVRLDNRRRSSAPDAATAAAAAGQTSAPVASADSEPADASQLQEGNDIYLACQLEANPRPSKPPVWRFNGRPITPQPAGPGADPNGRAAAAAMLQAEGAAAASAPGAVLVSGQSLVLRKVSRHQAGQYTCEAANQHGANASEPFELTVRHAPVCATDDM